MKANISKPKKGFFSIILLVIISCSKNEPTVPLCLDERKPDLIDIVDNSTNPSCADAAEIREYFFIDTYVYSIPSLCWIGGLESLYSSDCIPLGLVGGSNDYEKDGLLFSESAEFIRVVWSYP